MKVLADCSTAKMGGAQTYLGELLKAIERSHSTDQWVVCVPSEFDYAGPHGAGLEVIRNGIGNPLHYFAWLNLGLPKLARERQIEIVFGATGFGMLFPVCPQVLLVRNPIYFSPLYVSRIRELQLRFSVSIRRRLSLAMIARASAAVFPTRAMQNLVATHTKLDPQRIAVLPYGCDQAYFRSRKAESGQLPEPLRAAKGRFLLNVSLYCDQKNLTVLFQALGILRRRGWCWPLALTTHLRPASNCRFHEDMEIIRRESLRGQTIELGPQSRKQLSGLYQSAGLFVFPSYVESFGHPLVEAMAAGLPILAADTSVNREMCGDAALYAPPFDPEAWALAIQKLFGDSALQQELRCRAEKQLEAFSWDRHFNGLIEVFRRICDEKKGPRPSYRFQS